jgi:FeS cluster assembly scaffold protein NifU
MKSTQYTEKVLDHFRNPRNVGTLKGKDVSVGRIGNPVCGDLMEIYIKVKDNIIEDIKLKTFGCGSAIATASMISEMAKGKTLEQALKITRNNVADELDGLPPVKMHCSNLAADALHDAIKKYQEKSKKSRPSTPEKEANIKTIPGQDKFLGKGVYNQISDPAPLKEKRILILDNGQHSREWAKRLTDLTPRVVLLTSLVETDYDSELKKELISAGVKMLFESKLLEIKGFKEVEKVVIHDLNEDNEYELFVDAVVIL